MGGEEEKIIKTSTVENSFSFVSRTKRSDHSLIVLGVNFELFNKSVSILVADSNLPSYIDGGVVRIILQAAHT